MNVFRGYELHVSDLNKSSKVTTPSNISSEYIVFLIPFAETIVKNICFGVRQDLRKARFCHIWFYIKQQ